jgi:hypothetical protein
LTDYTKKLDSLTPTIVNTVKKIKESGEVPFLTKVVDEISEHINRKDVNDFMIRDAIIRSATLGKILINASGKKQLILELPNI